MKAFLLGTFIKIVFIQKCFIQATSNSSTNVALRHISQFKPFIFPSQKLILPFFAKKLAEKFQKITKQKKSVDLFGLKSSGGRKNGYEIMFCFI